MRRNAEKEKFWRDALAELASSGRRVREFCGQRGLKENVLYAWRRELRLRDAEEAVASGFVELVGTAGKRESAGVSLRVDERVSIVLERGFDRETLQATLACLCATAAPQRAKRAEAGAQVQLGAVRQP